MSKLALRLRQRHCLIPNLPLSPAFSPDWGAEERSTLWREGWGGLTGLRLKAEGSSGSGSGSGSSQAEYLAQSIFGGK